jgi:alkylresorcinol/alkylpyrone synthase
MPYLHSIETALPKYHYSQDELIKEFIRLVGGKIRNNSRIEMLQKNVQVDGRYLALPLEQYQGLKGFGDKNKHFEKVALELSK